MWMAANGLELAAEKTEAIVLIGRKKIQNTSVTIEQNVVNTSESVRYLGWK